LYLILIKQNNYNALKIVVFGGFGYFCLIIAT